MFSYHYYSGADGRRYCYSSQKTERCPLVTASAGPTELTAAGRIIADTLDTHGVNGERMIRHAHRSSSVQHEDGKCKCCGAKLETLGYAVWIEAPWDQIPQADDSARATRALNEHLGSTHGRMPGSFRYFLLKREAIQWCREEAEIDKASKREELAAQG